MINRTVLGRIVSISGFLAFLGYMAWFQYFAEGTLSPAEYNSGAALLVFIIVSDLLFNPTWDELWMRRPRQWWDTTVGPLFFVLG